MTRHLAGWTELDLRAVDTVRVLAADAGIREHDMRAALNAAVTSIRDSRDGGDRPA